MKQVATTARVAVPLVLASLAQAVNRLTDRFFLARHSGEALAASLPGCILALSFSVFAIAAIGYSGTVIAQRHGGGDSKGKLAAFAQGLWMCLFAVPFFALTLPAGCLCLDFAGHAPSSLLAAEKAYFTWSTPGGLFATLAAVLGGFFTGQGRTRLVGFATAAGFSSNIVLDAVLISGCGPVPALGITGAGIAFSAAAAVPALILAPAVVRDPLFRGRPAGALALDRGETMRILRPGLPDAFRSATGALAFLMFMMVAGRLGAVTLAVGNVCFVVNDLLHVVCTAIASAVTILVGHATGARDRGAARRSLFAGIALAMAASLIFYVAVLPVSGTIAGLYLPDDSGFDAAQFRRLGVALFAVMAFRSIFEAIYLVLGGALKGRGDTLSAMRIEIGCELLVWMPLAFAVMKLRPTPVAFWLTMPAWLAVAIALQALRLRRLKNGA